MSLRARVEARLPAAACKRAVVGFDGFIDTIARPLRATAAAGQPAQPFETIADFGAYLVGQAGKSCSVALSVESRRLGGNLPYLSRAAGRLGLDVTCIGMLGAPAVDPVFADMPCRLRSYAPAGEATALEFQDGKVFLASDVALPDDPWTLVTQAAPDAAGALGTADLIALVNWSELDFSHSLWENTLVRAVEPTAADKGKFAFFDLCDCARRSSDEIDRVLRLIGRFAARRTTILSLNENEALLCGGRLLCGETDPGRISAGLRRVYGVDEVLIHTVHETLLDTAGGLVRQPTLFVERPVISTGAGDNFNAASCFAAVLGLAPEDRVAFANQYAHDYITAGESPTLEAVLSRLD